MRERVRDYPQAAFRFAREDDRERRIQQAREQFIERMSFLTRGGWPVRAEEAFNAAVSILRAKNLMR